MLGSGPDVANDPNIIRIDPDKTRTCYFGGCGPPEIDLFDREGARVGWIYTTGENDGV
jgi:hypothetical protein